MQNYNNNNVGKIVKTSIDENERNFEKKKFETER